MDRGVVPDDVKCILLLNYFPVTQNGKRLFYFFSILFDGQKRSVLMLSL